MLVLGLRVGGRASTEMQHPWVVLRHEELIVRIHTPQRPFALTRKCQLWCRYVQSREKGMVRLMRNVRRGSRNRT